VRKRVRGSEGEKEIERREREKRDVED